MSKFHIPTQFPLAMNQLLRHTAKSLMTLVTVTALAPIIYLPLTAAETKTSTQISQANNLASKKFGVVLAVPSFLERNVNDDQATTDPNYEKWDRDHVPSAGEKNLKEVTITAKTDNTAGDLTLTVSGNIAAIKCPVSGFTDTIYWNDDKKNARYDQSDHVTLKWKLEANTPPFSVILYIEGVETSATPADIKFVAELTCGGGSAEDTGETAVYETDLDVDSNNNEGTEFTSGSREEDEIEFSTIPTNRYPAPNWSKRPGKIIVTNDGFGDDVPDWADGLIRGTPENQWEQMDELKPPIKFIPMKLERKTPFTDKCTVKFTYSASDPKDVIFDPGDGFPVDSTSTATSYGPKFSLADTTKKIRIWTADASSRDVWSIVYNGDYVQEGVEIKWSNLSSGTVANLWVEAVVPSTNVGDIEITAEMKEGSVNASDSLRLTSIQITCEPINSELQSGFYPYNSSGIVKGESSKFYIDVLPADYPNAEITWLAQGRGTCGPTTSIGNAKREAIFTATDAGGGYLIPIVKGNYYTDPVFPLEVFDTWSEVTLNVFITHHPITGSPAISSEDALALVTKANEIHKQSGIRFSTVIKPWTSGNGSQYFNLASTEQNDMFLNAQFDHGLRVVFVNTPPTPSTAGFHVKGKGIACRTDQFQVDDLAVILAHEIGHACGWEDIYSAKVDQLGGTPSLLELNERNPAYRSWSLRDWPEDGALNSQPAYYSRSNSATYATRQVDLINRLMMHGELSPSNFDIPLGTVYGVLGGYGPDRPLHLGWAIIGIDDIDRNPEHNY
jgi:hypothetical protein